MLNYQRVNPLIFQAWDLSEIPDVPTSLWHHKMWIGDLPTHGETGIKDGDVSNEEIIIHMMVNTHTYIYIRNEGWVSMFGQFHSQT